MTIVGEHLDSTPWYDVRTNVVLHGRSGQHEVDVLAETQDELTTYRVAVECKAWGNPIEKDDVAKLAYVVADLRLNKAIIVCPSGSRSGADQAAAELGIELWGPNELQAKLEPDLSPDTSHGSARRGLAYPFASTRDSAESVMRRSGMSSFGRVREPLVWESPVWITGFLLSISVAVPSGRGSKRVVRTAQVLNLYEGLSGNLVRWLLRGGEESLVELELSAPTIPPILAGHKIAGDIRKSFSRYQAVTSAAATQRHSAALTRAGLPCPCTSLTVEESRTVHLPV